MDPYDTADADTQANPYAAPAARVQEVASGDAMAKASRGARLAAVLVDAVPIMAIAMATAILVPAVGSGGNGAISPLGTAMLALMVGAFLAYGIYQLVMLHRRGQTFGKKLMGVRIVRTDGSRAGLGRIFWLRYFVPGAIGNIPLLGILFALADPLFIFGEEKRCLHDLFADTIVVDA
jgi:uncharacterized RDD family membrane protein YckC